MLHCVQILNPLRNRCALLQQVSIVQLLRRRCVFRTVSILSQRLHQEDRHVLQHPMHHFYVPHAVLCVTFVSFGFLQLFNLSALSFLLQQIRHVPAQIFDTLHLLWRQLKVLRDVWNLWLELDEFPFKFVRKSFLFGCKSSINFDSHRFDLTFELLQRNMHSFFEWIEVSLFTKRPQLSSIL